MTTILIGSFVFLAGVGFNWLSNPIEGVSDFNQRMNRHGKLNARLFTVFGIVLIAVGFASIVF